MTRNRVEKNGPRRLWGVGAGLLVVVALATWLPTARPLAGATDASVAGSQGTDTSLAATPSAVTVDGRGEFSSLKVTVNQTANLVNQAISVSWSGVAPTFSNATTGEFDSTFDGDFLQIFQCWGDPDPTDPLTPTDPGPPPSQCEFGGESNSPTSAYPIQDVGFQYSWVLSQPSWSTFASTDGWVDSGTGFKIEPFKAVDGTVVNQQADYNADSDPLNPKPFWQDPYFSFNTTNEVDFARTYPASGATKGAGQQLFQVDTGLEAPGLGCGQKLQPSAAGDVVPRCWLVIVPRSTPADENPSGLTGVNSVVTSPLAPAAWAHRIAIPLTFKPVDSTCAIGSDEVRIVGSELATSAITSWQPALCASPGSPPYNYSYLSDDRARDNLSSSSFGGAGMSVFSQPIDPTTVSPSAPLIYAPLTLSGVVIGFNIQRTPKLLPSGQLQPDEVPLAGVRVARMYLTPRLVAKLLTESYQAQLLDVTASKPPDDAWILHNPTSLVTDPDFVQFNPEFAELSTQQQLDAGDLVVEESTSDAASEVWNWVLADPEAKAWLAGQPDPWGMKVNPIYDTTTSLNPTGAAFGTPLPNSYPKSDPYCYDTGAQVGSPPQPARPICVLDWSPYALTMQAAAQATGNANDGGKTTLDISQTPDSAWAANGPQKAGTQFILSITDSASAARYGLQDASLSRSGDDKPSRAFVAPDQSGLLAGQAAMQPTSVADVEQTNPSTTAAGAYPLSMLTYAVTSPTTLTQTARDDYAAFVRYAAGPGETTGSGIGQLPAGYAPLPAALRAEADVAAAFIEHPPGTPSTPTTPTTQPLGTGNGDGGTGAIGGGTQTDGGQGSTAPPVTSGTPQSQQGAPATHLPTEKVSASQLARERTRRIEAGIIRLAVPSAFGIGTIAALLVPAFGRKRRRPKPLGGIAEPIPVAPRAAKTRRAPAGRRRPAVFEPWQA